MSERRRCVVCGDPFYGKVTRLTCSTACRQARSRRRRGQRHGWGGAVDRKLRRAASRAVGAVTGHG